MRKEYTLAAVAATANETTGKVSLWFGIVKGPYGGYKFLDKDNLLKLYERVTGRTDILEYASEHLILALSSKGSVIMQPVDCTTALQVYREYYLPSRNLRCHKLLTSFTGTSQRPYFDSKSCIIRDRAVPALESICKCCLIA